MREQVLRVLVVDDFEPFRRVVTFALRNMARLQVICEASDGVQAVRMAQELKPDLILMDLGLPGLNGIEAAWQIRKVSPDSKILFVSQEASPEIVQETLRLGAWGYIRKAGAGTRLQVAVDSILHGVKFFDG